MLNFTFVLLFCSFICFILAACSAPSRVNFTGLGLAFWVLTLLIKTI